MGEKERYFIFSFLPFFRKGGAGVARELDGLGGGRGLTVTIRKLFGKDKRDDIVHTMQKNTS